MTNTYKSEVNLSVLFRSRCYNHFSHGKYDNYSYDLRR